ncbi:hypothetical protein BH23GEM11_BH23GEM11_21540 [soil metagenome]
MAITLLFGALPLAGQDPAPVTVVVISVLDRLNGRPVPGAVVTLTPVDDAGAAVGDARAYGTDPAGRLSTGPLERGRYLLDARAPSYRGHSEVIEVVGPSPLRLSVQLEPDILALEEVEGTAARNPFLDEGGFYERRSQGFGQTYTREELALMGVFQTSDVFRTLSGVTLDYAGSPVSPILRFRQGCRPDIVLDGTNLGPDVRIDDLVNPTDIQGLEVYRGAGSPGTLSSNSCGSVIVWTLSRQIEGARPFSWHRVILGLVLLTIAEIIRP